MKKYILSILTIGAIASSCSDKFEFDPEVGSTTFTSGDANFTKFVSLGNSLTSGYADGALYSSAQSQSYPMIIATQMQLAGGGAFKQPLMPNDMGGFSNLGVSGKLTLQVVNGSLSPVASTAGGALDNISSGAPYQNLGVPGAKAVHLIAPGYGNPAGILAGTANPYFTRFATSSTTSVLQDAMAQTPTFFSLWIGNNDVLGYATNGGDAALAQITSQAQFDFAYSTLVNTLTSGGAKGVVANLPYVTSIPFFTTVPYNPVPLDAATASALNTQLIGPAKQVLTAYGQGNRIQLLSSTSLNPLLIKDESLTNLSTQITSALMASGVPAAQAGLVGTLMGQARHATASDLVLLTTRSVIGTAGVYPAPFDKYGVTLPLLDKHVLTATEVAECNMAVDNFNLTISNLATTKNLAFYNANTDMQALTSNSGIIFNGNTYTENFVTGGSFSLDGVHPNNRGYAVIANGFIKAINSKYHSNLPMVNPNNYMGVTFP